MKSIAIILVMALLGAGLGYSWHLYDENRYECHYATATVGAGRGTVYDIAVKYIDKQERYDLDALIYYIIEENGLTDGRYLTIQPGDVLRVPLWTLKK